MKTVDGVEITGPDMTVWVITRDIASSPCAVMNVTHGQVVGWGGGPEYSSKAAAIAQIKREMDELWEEHGRLTEWVAAMERDEIARLARGA